MSEIIVEQHEVGVVSRESILPSPRQSGINVHVGRDPPAGAAAGRRSGFQQKWTKKSQTSFNSLYLLDYSPLH